MLLTNSNVRNRSSNRALLGNGYLSPVFTLSRASPAALVYSTDGSLIEVGNNLPRFDPALGLLIEGQRTSGVRNPRGEGGTFGVIGSGGVLPTHWNSASAGGTGISREFVGRGIENGWDYSDFRVFGTASGGSVTIYLRYELFTQIAAATGVTWVASVSMRIAAGTLTGVSSIDVGASEFNSGGTYVSEQNTAVTLTGTRQRFTRPGTSGNAATIFISPQSRVNISNGATVDLTLRVYAPQAEVAVPFASSPILPPVGTVAAATRLADTLSAPLSSLGIGSNGACTVVGTFVLPQTVVNTLNQFLFQIIADADNRFFVTNSAGTSTITLVRRAAGAVAGIPSPITITAGQPVKVAASHNGAGRLTLSVNGSAAQEVTGAPTTGYISLEIGSYGGSNPLNGYAQLTSILPYPVSDAVLQQFSTL